MRSTFEQLCVEFDSGAAEPAALAERVARQESVLRVSDFGVEEAWELGIQLRELALACNLPVALAVQRGEQRLFHSALPGASANNDLWLARKIAVVQLFDQSSFRVGLEAQARGSDINDRLPATDYAAHGGAFPIHSPAGALLGVLAVSGLPSAHDHALAITVLANWSGASLELL